MLSAGVKVDEKECVMENLQNLISITAHDEVTAMSWGNNEEKEILLACGRKEIRRLYIISNLPKLRLTLLYIANLS